MAISVTDITEKISTAVDKASKKKRKSLSEETEQHYVVGEMKQQKKKRHTVAVDVNDVSADPQPQEESSKKDKKKRKRGKETEGGQDEEVLVDTGPATTVSTQDDKKSKTKHKMRAAVQGNAEASEHRTVDIDLRAAEAGTSDGKPKKLKKERKGGAGDEHRDREKTGKKRRREKAEVTESTEESASAATLPTPSNVATSEVTTISDADIDAFLSKHSINITSSSPPSPLAVLDFPSLFARIPTGLHSAFAGFTEPTPIQACSWPAALDGRDVVGIAETGSGKTLAFGVPGVARIVISGAHTSSAKPKKKGKSKSRISLLVLAPTRELAIQTHETLVVLGKPFGLSSIAVYGGVDKDPQRHALAAEGAAMVVGTPGRILDLLEEGALVLSGVTYLVLDEADRMLDKGFENDIRRILEKTAPAESRQTLMFSATWPDAVRKLAASFQRDPVRVTVGSADLTANSRVEQSIEVFDDNREKDSRLIKRLRGLHARQASKAMSPDDSRILVFVLYKKEASRVESTLQRQGYSVGAIHGDMGQGARISALEDFKSGKTQILVATDVAARGLDIPNVGTVINYSFPLTVEDYVHRIGRTGRGGKSGKSVTFFTGDGHERALAGELARVLRESGFDADPLKKFPMTIKKKTHSAYGAFFRDDIPATAAPTRLKF